MRGLALLLVAAACATAAPPPPRVVPPSPGTLPATAGHPADFSLHNRTGKAIYSLWISLQADGDWGDDLLGDHVLDNDERTDVTIAGDPSACVYDIKIALDKAAKETWVVEGIDLCHTDAVTLQMDGGKLVYGTE